MLEIDHCFSMLSGDLNLLIAAPLNFHYLLACSSGTVSEMPQTFDYIGVLHTDERRDRHNLQCKGLKIRLCEEVAFTYISTFTGDCPSTLSAKLFILSATHLCQLTSTRLVHLRKPLS